MSLYSEWMDIAQNAGHNQKENEQFWQQYFDHEKELYQQLLDLAK